MVDRKVLKERESVIKDLRTHTHTHITDAQILCNGLSRKKTPLNVLGNANFKCKFQTTVPTKVMMIGEKTKSKSLQKKGKEKKRSGGRAAFCKVKHAEA